MSVNIHPTAIVDPKAELGDGVSVGAFAIIEADVVIGTGTTVHHHAFVGTGARVGAHCTFHHSAVISNVPQDLKFNGSEKTYVHIGDGTTVREFATIHRATLHEAKTNSGTKDGTTRVGSKCLIMAYAHIAHDCNIGDQVILANGVQMGGHTTIESYATVGGLAGIHQFSQIGAYSMVGAHCYIQKDAPPYSLIGSTRTRFVGINRIGLERRGFTPEIIRLIREAYKVIYDSGMNVTDALRHIESQQAYNVPEIKRIIDFVRGSDRGILAS